mgnify:CR=1 FL=1
MAEDLVFQHALAAIKSGDIDTGRRLLMQVLEANPRHIDACRALADVEVDPVRRVQLMERVLDLSPFDAKAARALGLVPIDMGSGGGAFVAGLFAMVFGLLAVVFVNRATLGVAMVAGACLFAILGRIVQADYHQKNLLRMLSRVCSQR